MALTSTRPISNFVKNGVQVLDRLSGKVYVLQDNDHISRWSQFKYLEYLSFDIEKKVLTIVYPSGSKDMNKKPLSFSYPVEVVLPLAELYLVCWNDHAFWDFERDLLLLNHSIEDLNSRKNEIMKEQTKLYKRIKS